MVAKAKDDNLTDSLRLDIWLWAARFFRSRSLAQQAIKGGKVTYTGYKGAKARPASEVRLGTVLKVQQHNQLREVIVRQLTGKRQKAPLAALLYEETEDSVQARKAAAEIRKMQPNHRHFPVKPGKKERRVLARFKDNWRAS